MARYETAVRCPGDPDKTFEYLADFQTVSEWDPGVVDAEKITAGPVGLGTRYRVSVSFFGQVSALVYEITAFEPPYRVVLEAKNALLESYDEIRVQPLGTGSRVVYDAKLTLRGPLALGDPLLGVVFQRIGDQAARGLREALGGVED